MTTGEQSPLSPALRRQMRATLLNAGSGAVFCAIGLLGVLGLIVHAYPREATAPGLLLGGALGLGLVLWRPGKPTRVGDIFGTLPSTPSAFEQLLEAELRRRRRKGPVLAATAPFFAIIILDTLLNRSSLRLLSFGDYFLAALLANLLIVCLGFGVQWLQVYRDLGSDGDS